MRKMILLSMAFVFALCMGSASAQANCTYSTEIRGGEMWRVLQEDCDIQNITINDKVDLNGHDLNMVVPVPGWRVMGAAVTLGPNASLINGYVNGVDLLDQGACISGGDNRLTGIRIRFAQNVTVRDVTVSNFNFGPNVRCGEGFGIWVDGFTPDPGYVHLKNVKVNNYQRGGLLLTGHQRVIVENSDIGKCSSENVQPCNTVQVSGVSTMFGSNSHFAQNSNKSGYQSVLSVALVMASTGLRTELTNVQFREGNAERAVYVFQNTNSPRYDNLKISETGDDGPFTLDIGIEDRGFGAEVHNMDFDAKIRGYTTPVFFFIPIIVDAARISESALGIEQSPELIPE